MEARELLSTLYLDNPIRRELGIADELCASAIVTQGDDHKRNMLPLKRRVDRNLDGRRATRRDAVREPRPSFNLSDVHIQPPCHGRFPSIAGDILRDALDLRG